MRTPGLPLPESSRDDDRTLLPDLDATVLMPAPGGQATIVMPRPAIRSARPAVDLQRLVAGVNPLLSGASVLLALIAQLRATTDHADPAGLRRLLLVHVGDFEAVAAGAGVPRPRISAARYLLCTFDDEAIAATPRGASAGPSLLQEFHDERDGGEKVFELLERLMAEPAANRDLLELFYVCLALGFEGHYRGRPNGRALLDAAAARILDAVRPAQDAPDSSLSANWRGVSVGAGRLAVLPLWVVIALASALLIGLMLLLNGRLDTVADPVFRQMHAAPAALQLDRSQAAARPRLAPLLSSDVASGALTVRDESLRSVLTLASDPLFVAGSARLEAEQGELLGRIAAALKAQPGQIAVIGHTDDTPVASLQYPTNWHLSRERAIAVMSALAERGAPANRLRAEGRADAEPLQPNNGPAQRAGNRRVEIELRLPRPEETP
jgi:type VI secretion system protein ImpK